MKQNKREKGGGIAMISAALAILESEEQRNELTELYRENSKRFLNIALSKLHNVQDAEDAGRFSTTISKSLR